MSKQKAKWTPEPWSVEEGYSGSRTIAIMRSCDRSVSVMAPDKALPLPYDATDANAHRIAASVNACAALGPNPAKTLEEVREVLRQCERFVPNCDRDYPMLRARAAALLSQLGGTRK